MYIKDADGNYVEAKFADYYTAKEFYKKAEPSPDDTTAYKYTGWQVINNETYFFDKNGNKVTGEQVIQGAKYNFDSTGALMKGSGTMGIDVSKWNGNINWTAVKNSGVSFVIIRRQDRFKYKNRCYKGLLRDHQEQWLYSRRIC